MIYVKYLKYVVVHKFWVGIACFKAGILWRGIKHDFSKFLPSEYLPYARYFGGHIKKGRDKTGYYKPTETGDPAFEIAWLKHQNRNDHHWHYWVSPSEDGEKIYEMPDAAVLEMLCDWWGAGKAQKASTTTKEWWDINKDKMRFHPNTLDRINNLLEIHQMFNEKRSE